ncbi:MAG: hypothetical protein JXA71_19800 [Chitinispirillaceae bacterium]|nr:hypothetical protein [Chitinispirillaceae bacterium]
MRKEKKPSPVAAPAAIFYRTVKQSIAVVIAVALIKVFVLDIVSIKGDQMIPEILAGDRLLTFRLPYLPLVRGLFSPSPGKPVVFSYPFGHKRGCLRIAGVPGDTILVDSGRLKKPDLAQRTLPRSTAVKAEQLLPPDYSPRDFMPAFRIPSPGEAMLLDSLDLFNLFMLISIIRQEDPASACSLSAVLEIDGTMAPEYHIADFMLYKGALQEVPDSMRYDWFFWFRLKEYLKRSYPDRLHRIVFLFIKDGNVVERYTIRKRFLFLVADNWMDGYDSRFFGPVIQTRLFGRPLAVLWSLTKKHGMNLKRLGKFIS